MWLLEPFTLQPEAVTYSNIVEDDAATWASGSTYNTADIVMYEHSVWKCLQDGVTSEPSDAVPTEWFRQGPTNKFRPFDQSNDTQAERLETITYTVVPGKRLDRVWFLDLDAVSVQLAIVAGGVTVYDKTISALRSENRNTFYTWFFAPKEYQTKVAFADVPTYTDVSNAEFKITISKPNGTVKVGEILFGQNWAVGETLFETEPRILNFSRDTRDEFGNAILTRRRAVREISYAVAVDPTRLGYVFDRFERLTATKLLFSAGDDLENYGTTVFGTLADLVGPIQSPNTTKITIQAKGFIA